MGAITRMLSATMTAALTTGVLVVGGVSAASAAPADLDVVPREDCPLSAEERAERHADRAQRRAERAEAHELRRGERDERCTQAPEACPLSEEQRTQRWQERDERRAQRDEAGGRPDGRGHGPGSPAMGTRGQGRSTP